MFAGTESVSVTLAASEGPPFETVTLYAAVVFDGVVEGPLLVTERFVLVATVVAAVELLFPVIASLVVEVTVAVLVIVEPEAAEGDTCTVMANVALAPEANVAMLQETVVPVVQVKVGPVVWFSDTKVVFAGSVSVHETFAAVEGPALATVMV
jgi:hypothetical protein